MGEGFIAMNSSLRVRLARSGDARQLTAIAHAAKAWWGYPDADLQRWRDELTFTPALIRSVPTWVAGLCGRLVGVAQLRTEPEFELEACWVHPDAMGQGVGTRLVRTVYREMLRRGGVSLCIDADPHAEGFYLRLGAVRIGATSAPITVDPDRVRPLLRLEGISAG
jgi:GNAT superfamily N-acetyltransferase